MRAKITSLLLPFALILGASTAFAQDELPNPDFNNYQENVYDEKPLLYEEGKSSQRQQQQQQIIVRDTAYARPSAGNSKPKANNASDKKPAPTSNPAADPLNFNFLYYIFQKFKASDMMMEE